MHSVHRPPLKKRMLNASVWSLAGYGLSQVLRFGSNLIMTRLLAPEMFGVMAIANMVMVGLTLFSDLGLKQSIVQSERGDDPDFLNTAWVIQILRGVLLWLLALSLSLIVFLCASHGFAVKGTAYADPILPMVIAILALSVAIEATQSTKQFEASRYLSLNRVTLVDISAQIVGVICMLAWAVVDRSIWALVAGGLCAAMAKAVLTHLVLLGTANRWCWDQSAVREIVRFGKWIFLSSAIGFLVMNGDRVLLAGLVDSRTFGIYVIAFSMFAVLDTMLSSVIVNVLYPALSEIHRNRPEDLKSSYYRFHAIVGSFTYFCAGVLWVSGHTLISLLYDVRYHEAGWMLQILSVALVVAPVNIANQCFMILGAPNVLSQLGAIRLVTLIFAVPIGFHLFGLAGAIWGVVVSQFAWLPTAIIHRTRYRLFDAKKELSLLPMLIVGVIAGEVVNGILGGWKH